VLSKNAPAGLILPEVLAIVPSIRSEKTNNKITRVPTKNSPLGKNTNADTEIPAVPISVTEFGVRPSFKRNFATGSTKIPTTFLALLLSNILAS
jgi:hypothetical protein